MDARWRIIRDWVMGAKRAGVPAVIIGADGKSWQSDAVNQMMLEGTVSQSWHRWCYWDIRLWPPGTLPGDRDLPSSRRYRTLSTIQIPSHLCPHSQHQKHYQDVAEDNKVGRNRANAERLLTRRLLATLDVSPEPSRVPESTIQESNPESRSKIQPRSMMDGSGPWDGEPPSREKQQQHQTLMSRESMGGPSPWDEGAPQSELRMGGPSPPPTVESARDGPSPWDEGASGPIKQVRLMNVVLAVAQVRKETCKQQLAAALATAVLLRTPSQLTRESDRRRRRRGGKQPTPRLRASTDRKRSTLKIIMMIAAMTCQA